MRAALEAVRDLGRVEAEGFGVAEATDDAALVRAAERVSGIEQERELVTLGNVGEAARVAGPAPQMHPEDRRRAGRDQLLGPGRIERPARRVHVREHRPKAQPANRVRGRHEGEGGHDDLAAQAACPHQQLQRGRAVAGGDAVLDAQHPAQPLLEAAHHRAVVGQPGTVEDLIEAGGQVGAVAEVGAADVERGVELPRPAEQREVVEAGLHR